MTHLRWVNTDGDLGDDLPVLNRLALRDVF